MKNTLMLIALTLGLNTFAAPSLWTDAKDKTLPADFKVQGEYLGELSCGCDVGAQVIALGGGEFQMVIYPGGLPGDGWDKGDDRSLFSGKLQGKKAVFANAIGKRRYLGGRANEFSATRQYPPKGQKEGEAVIENGKLTGTYGKKKITMERIERKSPTLGAKPPEGAIVLFDGTSAKNFKPGKMSEDKLLMQGANSIQRFGSHKLHIEFRLPYQPKSRGQGRGNSGCYLQARYEVQMLDSFGLKGHHNECGGIYSIKPPDVNMCFPPLSWQTYDMEFTAAKFEDGKKVADAVVTVWHNGVKIHDKVKLPKRTTASPLPEGPEPGFLHLQNHGNPVRYRNIWVVPIK